MANNRPHIDPEDLKRSMFFARFDLLEQAKARWAREHPMPYARALRLYGRMAAQVRRAAAGPLADRPALPLHKLHYARAINAR